MYAIKSIVVASMLGAPQTGTTHVNGITNVDFPIEGISVKAVPATCRVGPNQVLCRPTRLREIV